MNCPSCGSDNLTPQSKGAKFERIGWVCGECGFSWNEREMTCPKCGVQMAPHKRLKNVLVCPTCWFKWDTEEGCQVTHSHAGATVESPRYRVVYHHRMPDGKKVPVWERVSGPLDKFLKSKEKAEID